MTIETFGLVLAGGLARRMGGGPGHLAVMADSERALGHPERAIELSRSAEADDLDEDAAIELAIVVAGARADLGQIDAALAHLERIGWREDAPNARIAYAYADLLLQAGRRQEALTWFVRAADADADERLFRLGCAVLDALAVGTPPDALARYFECWLLRLQGVYPNDLSLSSEAVAFVEATRSTIPADVGQLGASIGVLRELERQVVLSVLDRKWREHLYEMDYLREGIYLRAYSQRDPLVEYQREGFDMFAAMMDGIKEESVGFLFNLQVEIAEDDGDDEHDHDHDHAHDHDHDHDGAHATPGSAKDAADFKRPRACDSCRGLKVRCDQERPDVSCKRCAKAGRPW